MFLIAACSCGGGCGGAKQASSGQDGGSEATALPVPAEPGDPAARLEAARQALAKAPGDVATQDAFERAWLDVEFLALGEELKGPRSKAPALDFGDCAGASARDCIGQRIGLRYDSTWTRAEVRDTAVLLLVFHARSDHDEDTESGNELVVFRGRLVSKPGGPPKLDLVSRQASKVSDALGAALGRRAVAPDIKDGNILWGIRFEPLSPKAFSTVASLPDEWVKRFEGPNRDEVFVGVAGDRGRWFIHKEPKLRMAWLSWSEREGRLEPLLDVTRKGSTWQLGRHRLRWSAESQPVGTLVRGDRTGPGETWLPARDEISLMYTPSRLRLEDKEPEEPWTDEELALPQAVRRHLVACTSRSARELKPGLYEARCGCGNPCGYATFVDVNGGRTSHTFWLPLGVDAEKERIAVSTETKMPIRIVGMFDEREWAVIRRPAGDATELSHIVEATFTGDQLHLKYSDRRWQDVEEVVELPKQVPLPRPEDARRFVQDLASGEADLHTYPEMKAEVVTSVSSGTECRLLEDLPGPWVYLECGGLYGFMVGSLLGPDKPRLDAPPVPARSPKSSGLDLDALLREPAPDTDGGAAPKPLPERFFDASFEQLERVGRARGLGERFRVTREGQTRQEALVRELEKIEFDWHRLEVRGQDFVSAMRRDGALVVYAGFITNLQYRWGSDKEEEEEFLVHIRWRDRLDAPEALLLALQQDARPAPPDGPAYSALEQEYAGMPELGLEALPLYQSLPRRWHTLHTRPGSRFVTSRCDFVAGAELRMDVHRRASLRFGELGPRTTRVREALRVTRLEKTASGYRLQVRAAPDDTRLLTLDWPTPALNVSRWRSTPPASTDGDYATELASNLDLDDLGCSR